MATKVGEAYVLISAGLKPLERGLARAYAMTKSFASSMGSRIFTSVFKAMKGAVDRLYHSLKRVAKWAAIGFGAVTAGLVKLAANAEESENLFEVSLGNMAKDARKWSISLSRDLGISEYALRENVGIFKVMLESMGITSRGAYKMGAAMTELAYDMASFYNLKTEDAFLKIRAGISGETEPLKRLGILLNETTIKTYALNSGMIRKGETLTEMQKVLARYGLLMERTSMAQGDLARTSGSLTNVWRSTKDVIKDLGVEIGTTLLPRTNKALTAFRDWLKTNKSDIIAWANNFYTQLGRVGDKFYDFASAMVTDWRAGVQMLTSIFMIGLKGLAAITITMGTQIGKDIVRAIIPKASDILAGLAKTMAEVANKIKYIAPIPAAHMMLQAAAVGGAAIKAKKAEVPVGTGLAESLELSKNIVKDMAQEMLAVVNAGITNITDPAGIKVQKKQIDTEWAAHEQERRQRHADEKVTQLLNGMQDVAAAIVTAVKGRPGEM